MITEFRRAFFEELHKLASITYAKPTSGFAATHGSLLQAQKAQRQGKPLPVGVTPFALSHFQTRRDATRRTGSGAEAFIAKRNMDKYNLKNVNFRRPTTEMS